jgi:hypothetical protein
MFTLVVSPPRERPRSPPWQASPSEGIVTTPNFSELTIEYVRGWPYSVYLNSPSTFYLIFYASTHETVRSTVCDTNEAQ